MAWPFVLTPIGLRANEQRVVGDFARFARGLFGEAWVGWTLLALLAAFFPLGRADGGFARLLARDLAKAMRTFARLLAGR
jgi:hypothetical protein